MSASGSGEPPARALRRHGLSPRKRLGQNFLRDWRFLDRILEAAEIGTGDEVLEVGAGTGVLTAALLTRTRRVLAVELDDALFHLLRQEFAGATNLELWHGNALDFDPCLHFQSAYKLVGNIPYYVTGPILRHFLEAECQPSVLVLMVQREVAERMVAAPGELSLLGVSVQFYARAEIVTRVPAGAFYPRPKVDSAIVRLTPRRSSFPMEARQDFFDVARAGFGTRRKTMTNALVTGLDLERDGARALLSEAGIEEHRRAETLALPEWERLATAWGSLRREADGR